MGETIRRCNTSFLFFSFIFFSISSSRSCMRLNNTERGTETTGLGGRGLLLDGKWGEKEKFFWIFLFIFFSFGKRNLGTGVSFRFGPERFRKGVGLGWVDGVQKPGGFYKKVWDTDTGGGGVSFLLLFGKRRPLMSAVRLSFFCFFFFFLFCRFSFPSNNKQGDWSFFSFAFMAGGANRMWKSMVIRVGILGCYWTGCCWGWCSKFWFLSRMYWI